MTDDRIVRVLEEIRDLQRQHVELGFAAVVLGLAVGMLILLLMRVLARVP
jgi:hypothetical protein